MRFRLAPTPAQEVALLEHCAHARFVWNLACEQHRHWRPGRASAPGHAEQSRQLTEARKEFGWPAAGSQTVQQQARGTVAAPGRNVRAEAGLNRSVHAAGWGRLVERLEDKPPGRVERVDPVFTSQICHACGHRVAANRESQAVFRCRACGHGDHADVNAAENIAAGRAVTYPTRPTDPGRPPGRGALQPLGGAVNREPQPALSSR